MDDRTFSIDILRQGAETASNEIILKAGERKYSINEVYEMLVKGPESRKEISDIIYSDEKNILLSEFFRAKFLELYKNWEDSEEVIISDFDRDWTCRDIYSAIRDGSDDEEWLKTFIGGCIDYAVFRLNQEKPS